MNSLLEAIRSLKEDIPFEDDVDIVGKTWDDLNGEEEAWVNAHLDDIISKFYQQNIELAVDSVGYGNEAEAVDGQCEIVDIYWDEGIQIDVRYYDIEPPEDYRGPVRGPGDLKGYACITPEQLGLPKNYTIDQLFTFLEELNLKEFNDLVYEPLSDSLH